jgi:hypothetical protein
VFVACFKVGRTGDKIEKSQVTQSRAGIRTKDHQNTKQFLYSGIRWYKSQLEMRGVGCEIWVLLNCFLCIPLCAAELTMLVQVGACFGRWHVLLSIDVG